MEHFEVAIAGAGPAGSSCANAALLGGCKSVALIDRFTFPRDKCCGDGLGAGVVDVLERLQLSDAFRDRPWIKRLSMNFFEKVNVGYDTDDLGRESPFAHVIPRLEFDNFLTSAALERGAADFTGWELKSLQREDQCWRLELAGPDGRRRQITASVLVGADGARSRVRRALGLPLVSGERAVIAIRGYVDVPATSKGSARLDILKGMPYPGYCWLFSEGDGKGNIGFGASVPVCKKVDARLDKLLAQYTAYLDDKLLSEPRATSTAIIPIGYEPSTIAHPQMGAALIGDAASMVIPANGEGIFFAMYAGMLLGEKLAAASGEGQSTSAALNSYQLEFNRAFAKTFRHSWIIMKLTSFTWFLERLTKASVISPDVSFDFTEALMGVMPPRKAKSIPGLVGRMLLPSFGKKAHLETNSPGSK